MTTDKVQREIDWLRSEVAAAANPTDADRVAILLDLWNTGEAIRATESADQLAREEAAREALDGVGLQRYRQLAERLGR